MASIMYSEAPALDCVMLLDPADSPNAWDEHDTLQTSIWSRYSFLKAHQLLDGAQIARVISDGEVRRSLVFRIKDRSAFVYGILTASARDFLLVANRILEQDANIRYVRSEPLVRDPDVESDPRVIIVGKHDDLTRALPQTVAELDLSLPERQANRLRSYERRFQRIFPESCVSILRGTEISAQTFHSVFELKRKRMRLKGYSPDIDESMETRMWKVAIENGILVTLNNGDDLVAGEVLYMASDNVYGWLMSQNPRYDKYSPGLICLYGAMKYLISLGVRRFHFLWGDSPYKRQFGAAPDDLASYVVLRPGVSRWAILPLLIHFYRDTIKSEIVKKTKEHAWFVRLYRRIRFECLGKEI